MKRLIAIALAALILASGLLAAPATRSTAKVAASQPTTAPTLADPVFVANFNEHLINSKFDDVIAKLRGLGATAGEPTRFGGKDPYRWYSLSLGYSWEYASYTFFVDDKGLIYKYDFQTTHWPAAPDSDVHRRDPKFKLKPGNKWYLTHRYPQPVPGFGDGRNSLMVVQAASPAAAAAEMADKINKDDKQTAAMMEKMGKPFPLAPVKLADIEVHEWFTPQLKAQHQDR